VKVKVNQRKHHFEREDSVGDIHEVVEVSFHAQYRKPHSLNPEPAPKVKGNRRRQLSAYRETERLNVQLVNSLGCNISAVGVGRLQ
jgi:hypothetical protein